MSKATELFYKLAFDAIVRRSMFSPMQLSGQRGPLPGKPGETILKLPPEERELLREVRSADVAKVRVQELAQLYADQFQRS